MFNPNRRNSNYEQRESGREENPNRRSDNFEQRESSREEKRGVGRRVLDFLRKEKGEEEK